MTKKPARAKPEGPGSVIADRAFKYSCSFFDFAEKKYPRLTQYPTEPARGALLQAAIIVSVLILLERRSPGAGQKELHENVVRSFPPSVAHRNMAAVQELACALLKTERRGLRADEIPSFAGLAGAEDRALIEGVSAWLIRILAKKDAMDDEDRAVAAAVGRSAWNSAAMIVRMLTNERKSDAPPPA